MPPGIDERIGISVYLMGLADTGHLTPACRYAGGSSSTASPTETRPRSTVDA